MGVEQNEFVCGGGQTDLQDVMFRLATIWDMKLLSHHHIKSYWRQCSYKSVKFKLQFKVRILSNKLQAY